MIVDNIMVEDLVNFQKVECEIIRGYKLTDLKDFIIKKVIRNVFNKVWNIKNKVMHFKKFINLL